MKTKKWNILLTNNALDKIDLDIPNLTKKVLFSRGYNTKYKIQDFLSSKEVPLNDAFLLKDMQKACDIIYQSIENREKIVIFGDYDVDGITSTFILVDYLLKKGADVTYYIPDRATEGYGLSITALDKLTYADLIITVDCGITAVDEVSYLNDLGIKVIITDHHSCKEILPNALALINPKQKDCPYPFKELAGVGVCFKLISALEKDSEKILSLYSDIIAIGTIADVMPLISENRRIVSDGILRLNKTNNLGLHTLITEVGLTDISSTGISFRIAPRLNASGRMGLAKDAVELLLTKDNSVAKNISQDLCEKNLLRQQQEAEILESACIEIEKEIIDRDLRILIVCKENWHHGIVGIVSSRIIEKYNLPVIIMSKENGIAKGSGRSIKGFNIFDALVLNDSLLLKYGGHKMAAGLTMDYANFDEFKLNMEKIANDLITDEMLIFELDIDVEIKFLEITLDEVNSLSLLDPYGAGNTQPIFCSKEVKISKILSLSNDKHLKITFLQDDITFAGMLFSTSRSQFDFNEGDIVNIAYYLSINEFRDTKSVQLIIKDIVDTFNDNLKLYEKFKNSDLLTNYETEKLIPTRKDFIKIWTNIKETEQVFSINEFSKKTELSPCIVLIGLDVFYETNLINFKNVDYNLTISKKDVDFKVNLNDSKTLKSLLQKE